MLQFITNNLVIRIEMINNPKVIMDKLFKTIVILDRMWHNDVVDSSINHKEHMRCH